MINVKSLIVAVVAALGLFAVSAVNALPKTKLTRNCKSLVNVNMKLPKPPLKGLKERDQKRLMKGLEKLADSKYPEAIEIFQQLAQKDDSYVKSLAYQNLAAAYSQQGKYKESLPFFENALKYGEGNLPHEQVQKLRYNVAALFYQVDRPKDSIRLLNEWLKKSNKEESQVYVLLTALYLKDNRFKDAICPAYLGVKYADKPKKSYYGNLMFVHYELKDVEGAAAILKEMVELFPDETTYWRQLSSLYMELDKSDNSLYTTHMLYLLNRFDKESDFKTLSSLYAYADLPYQAADSLKEGIKKGLVKAEEKNWRNIAQNYQVANETDLAITAWSETAKLASDGKPYEKLAMLYNEKDRFREAISALNKAIAKGNLDNLGGAHMNKGIAQINLGKCSSGIKTLRQATKYKSVRKQALAWIGYAEDRVRKNKCS